MNKIGNHIKVEKDSSVRSSFWLFFLFWERLLSRKDIMP